MTIRAILDTNVLISGIFWKGAPFEILRAWQKRCFHLIISPSIFEEYRRVLDEMTRKRVSAAAQSILEIIELHAEMAWPVAFAKPVCDDPDDDKFLEAALAAGADYIVSGDAALLRLKNIQRTGIIRPAHFLKLLPS